MIPLERFDAYNGLSLGKGAVQICPNDPDS